MSLTSIKGKDWVFNALWAASSSSMLSNEKGNPHDFDDSSIQSFASNSTKSQCRILPCLLAIPFTSIFMDGMPLKNLMTDSTGKIVRVYLDKVPLDRNDANSGLRGSSLQPLRAIRKLLIDFSSLHGYDLAQQNQEEVFIAKIIYTDDQIENVSAKTLDFLLRNESWRLQVLLIQGYVPSISVQGGLYSRTPVVRSLLESSSAAAADQLTRSIAKYVERAYSMNAQQVMNGKSSEAKGIALRVDNIRCSFALDPSGRVLFLHAEYTAVEIENSRREVEELMQEEKNSRESAAAEKVGVELINLIVHAYQRGLSIESSFKHFDVNGDGYVNTEMLIDGLARLGIGVTYPVGENVLQMIGGTGSNFFTLGDFESYMRAHVNESNEAKNKDVFQDEEFENKVNKEASVKKKKRERELLPPTKQVHSLDISSSQAYRFDELPANQLLPLALPEEMYTTNAPGSTLQHSGSVGSLPSWASARSKRALKQLGGSARPKIAPSKAEAKHHSNASISKSEGRGTKKSSSSATVESLNLQSLTADLSMASSDSSKDELLHIDKGVFMTYRILDGHEIERALIRKRQKSDNLRYRSILEEREKNMAKGHEEEFSEARRQEEERTGKEAEAEEKNSFDNLPSMTLVVVPDITMTLDTLQAFLDVLRQTHPLLRVVLVGLIGLPNTMWPADWVINSDLQAKCIANLIKHLDTSERLFYRPSLEPDEEKLPDNLVLMGFGVGAFHLSRFVCQHIGNLSPAIHSSIRSVVFVNGFLKMNKKFRNICKDLRNAMMKANTYEANELITTLHFSDDYLARTERDASLRKFWLTRRDLRPAKVNEKGRGGMNGHKEDGGWEYIGLLEQLKGIVVTPDDYDGAMVLVNTTYPIVVIQGTEDVFVDPKVAAIFSPNQLPPERVLVTDLMNTIDENTVHITWLKAGHELLQERTPFVLSIITNIAKLYGLDPERKVVQEKEIASQSDDLFDVLRAEEDLSEGEQEEEAAKSEHDSADEFDGNLSLEDSSVGGQSSVTEPIQAWQAPEASVPEEKSAMKSTESQSIAIDAVSEEQGDKASLALKEKIKRAKLTMEKRLKQMKQTRQNQLDLLYQKEREDMDRLKERRERKVMLKEDHRSRFAAEYHREQQIVSLSNQLAREKAIQLKKLRKEEALKKVEEEMARKRSERIEHRRRQAMEIVQQIQSEELTLQGMTEGGYDMPDNAENVNAVIEASDRILKDMFECRQKYVEAIKRQISMQEKFTLFKKQLMTIENEERRLRRAIRLIEVNPAIVGKEMNAEAQLAELRSSLHTKQETLNELLSLSQQRENQLHAANRSVQLLKFATKERDAIMGQRIGELNQVDLKFTNRLQTLKVEKENLLVRRDRLRLDQMTHQKRVDTVAKELQRVREHKGKLIDTDMWIEGVMQRCITKELKKHLKVELIKAEEVRDKTNEEIESIKLRLFDVSELMAQVRRACDKIFNVTKIFNKAYQKYRASSVEAIVANLMKLQSQAQQLENRRGKEADIEKAFAAAASNNLVDKVRLKESEIRTKDERQFVGIDLVMNPEEYLHLSPVEAEQMQFDEDYQCSLNKEDLERISNLPEMVNLALPFLYTPEEVNAHRLINKFFRNKDENYYKEKDYFSASAKDSEGHDDQSTLTFKSSLKTADMTLMPSATETREAETVHDILVKEALRDRLRNIFDDEKLTEEEKRWIEVDKVLAPHIYGLDEPTAEEDSNETETTAPEVIVQSLNTSMMRNVSVNGKAEHRTKPHETDGDLYQSIRERYDEGEDLFGYEWRCPFNKKQLLRIHTTPGVQLSTQEELDIKDLFAKYYVSDAESILGFAKLSLLSRLTGQVISAMKKADRKADDELQANKKMMLEKKSVSNVGKTLANSSVSSSSAQNSNGNAHATGPEESIGTARSFLSDDMSLKQEDNEVYITRVWGSWNQVHPASQGKESQQSLFYAEVFDPARDHPGSFGERDKDKIVSDDEDDDSPAAAGELGLVEATGSILSPRSKGLKVLTGMPGATADPSDHKKKSRNDAKSKYFIVESIAELAQQEYKLLRGKAVILEQSEPMVLFEINDQMIQSRQSRSHYFNIPDRDSARVLELSVSVLFQGSFSTAGYKLGRIAAGLFRLPPPRSKSEAPPVPIPIGFTPHETVSPNLPDIMGRLVILHKPKRQPIVPGSFQIIIGSASISKYSIQVTAKYAKTALPVVDDEIAKAKGMQTRLPFCLAELDSIAESLRLAERKLLVSEKLILEAELETNRCQTALRALTEKLVKDDEEMLLLEDERREVQRELAIFEVEFAEWTALFQSRCKEKQDIKEGIQMMYKFRREREDEKAKIQKELEEARRDLPACMRLLRTMTEAVNVAASLNTVVQGISEEAGAAASGDYGALRFSTPADDVRRHMKQFGFQALHLEEQQWCLLDQTLNPSKYEWLREMEDKERLEREALGKPAKVEKLNAAHEPFRMSKSEIEYILETPFSMLNRREVTVRKLLTKFHDDADFMKKSLAAAAYSFDPHLAERTRAKVPSTYTREEREWSTIDRKLHPEIWKYYVNRSDNFMDRHSKEAALRADDQKTVKRNGKAQQAALATDADSSTIVSSSVDPADMSVSASSGAGVGEVDFSALVKKLQQSTAIQLRDNKPAVIEPESWSCPFEKEEVFRIWKTPRHFLKSDDERRVYKHLQKYNGPYTSYMDLMLSAQRRRAKLTKSGHHIQWDKAGKLVSKDVDYRARQILREIDRAVTTKSEFMHSDVLHANDQKFPTKVLLVHLEEALDNLLKEQIQDRERADKLRVDGSDSEEESAVPQRELADLTVDGLDANRQPEMLDKVKKRAEKRMKRKERLKALTMEEEVMQTKKVIEGSKASQALLDMVLKSQLGKGACLACRAKKCRWNSAIDYEACELRKEEIDGEIERIRLDRNAAVFSSEVCLSAQLGGNKIFRRADLLDELNYELREIDLRIELDQIDKELHDAYASRKEFFESRQLHGFAVLLWTNNARKALEDRQSHLVAKLVAREVVDDILDNMLEGWVFGERQSNFRAVGFVPSIKTGSNLRAGSEQISSVMRVVAKMKTRAELKRKGFVEDEKKRGMMIEKAYEIELKGQENRVKIKVAREKNEHEHLLNETEQTLRFGLFMLTLMYFRAMTFVRREQRSWAGQDEEIGVKGKNAHKVMTDERMRMIDEENKVRMRQKKIDSIMAKVRVGEARRREREERERREALMRLQTVVRRQRLELASITILQKVYRGHLGRKAAKRWALKRAELSAMNALLNATAITIQRSYRGYRGRVLTIFKRMEMAQFIALMRVQESSQDEEMYWQTHPWSRFKRNQREWMNQKLLKYRENRVVGGGRLSAEEEAKLQGKSLEEVQKELEGLGGVEGEDDDAGSKRGLLRGLSSRGASKRSDSMKSKISLDWSDEEDEEN